MGCISAKNKSVTLSSLNKDGASLPLDNHQGIKNTKRDNFKIKYYSQSIPTKP